MVFFKSKGGLLKLLDVLVFFLDRHMGAPLLVHHFDRCSELCSVFKTDAGDVLPFVIY